MPILLPISFSYQDYSRAGCPSQLRPGIGLAAQAEEVETRLAGTWTEQEHERFEAAFAATDLIDEDLWQ